MFESIVLISIGVGSLILYGIGLYSVVKLDECNKHWHENARLVTVGSKWQIIPLDGCGDWGYGIVKQLEPFNGRLHATMDIYWPDGDYRRTDIWVLEYNASYCNFFDTFKYKV